MNTEILANPPLDDSDEGEDTTTGVHTPGSDCGPARAQLQQLRLQYSINSWIKRLLNGEAHAYEQIKRFILSRPQDYRVKLILEPLLQNRDNVYVQTLCADLSNQGLRHVRELLEAEPKHQPVSPASNPQPAPAVNPQPEPTRIFNPQPRMRPPGALPEDN